MNEVKRISLRAILVLLGLTVGACQGPSSPGTASNGNENGEPADGQDGDSQPVAGSEFPTTGGLIAELPMSAEEEAAFREVNEDCLTCHEPLHPGMVQDYMLSTKAKLGVTCQACHPDNEGVAAGEEGHRFLPTPETCGVCHPHQYEGHRANRHSIAYIRMLECGRYDDFPKEFEVGSGYHFNEEDVEQLRELMGSTGQTAPADAVVTSVQMCGQCHNVENRCDSCHFRHRFSRAEARSPEACATCHMGPDHPHIEMYEHSKHGSRYAAYGDTESVPVCVDCHMPFNSQMLGKKTAEDGTVYTDHDLAMGIAYGPVGGGTTRKGFLMEGASNRVKFSARDDDAEYPDGLWLERADGKLYDAADSGNDVFDNLADMGFADASENGKQDYAVAQPADPPEKLLEEREFMQTRVCARCHTDNFADEQLLIADLIHENTKSIQMEAFDIVRALAIVDGNPIDVDDRPGNLETGTTGLYGANMVLRNLNNIETIYFRAMKYSNVKTWKGAYHQNPDYTHWYGWSELLMNLDDIADEGTDNILLRMWMNGGTYLGESGDLVADRLYQGVLFSPGSMTNLYDKFPGPGDPEAGEPIDVDMDGVPEFIPVGGSPGTFTYDGGEITFH